MNKKEILQVIRNPKTLDEARLGEVEKVAAEFPYFQGAHTLIAVARERLKLDGHRQSLARAALYTTDRKFLKTLIESIAAGPHEQIEEQETAAVAPVAADIPPAVVEPGPAPETSTVVSQPATEKIQAEQEKELSQKKSKFHVEDDIREDAEEKDLNEILYLSHDDLLKEVFQNLEELKKSKTYYLEVERQIEDAEFEEAQAKAVKKATTRQSPGKTASKTKPATPVNKNGKSAAAVAPKTKKETEKGAEVKITRADNEEKALQAPRKLDQLQIIDEFIRKNPTIKSPSPADLKAPAVDLSAPSQQLKDDLVTENLALIYIKQGRKDKAIDVYRKLILKFPQKKSYFAAQIKDLQK